MTYSQAGNLSLKELKRLVRLEIFRKHNTMILIFSIGITTMFLTELLNPSSRTFITSFFCLFAFPLLGLTWLVYHFLYWPNSRKFENATYSALKPATFGFSDKVFIAQYKDLEEIKVDLSQLHEFIEYRSHFVVWQSNESVHFIPRALFTCDAQRRFCDALKTSVGSRAPEEGKWSETRK